MEINYEKREIIFADHLIRMNDVSGAPESSLRCYLEEMAEELSPLGSAREHAAELRNMNNDGTWAIESKMAKALYQVYDRQTGALMGKPCSLKAAIRKVDRLDLAYGACRYGKRRVEA